MVVARRLLGIEFSVQFALLFLVRRWPPAKRPAVPTICGASERDSVSACDL